MKWPRLVRKDRSALEEGVRRDRGLQQLRAKVEEAGPFVTKNALATRLFLLLMVAGLLCGPLAIGLWYIGTKAPAQAIVTQGSVQETDDATARQRVLAEGAATDLAWRWAGATAQDFRALAGELGIPPSSDAAAPQKITSPVRDVTVVDSTPLQPVSDPVTRWQVSVLVRGGVAGPDPAAYLILVDIQDEVPRPVSLPGQIPLPASTTERIATSTLVPTKHPLAKALTGWAGAMLAGQGDVSPWLAPGVAMTSIQPAVCDKPVVTAVALGQIPDEVPQNGQTASVALTVACGTGTNQARTFGYLLDVRGRDQRWEVLGFATTPAQAARPASSTTPSPTPESTPS